MTKNKRLSLVVGAVAGLLLIPFIAMQFTNEVNWSPFDFGIAAFLLLGTGLVIEFILRKTNSPQRRLLLVGAVLIILLLVWAELAVGLFGTPLAGS